LRQIRVALAQVRMHAWSEHVISPMGGTPQPVGDAKNPALRRLLVAGVALMPPG